MRTFYFKVQEIGNIVLVKKKDWEKAIKWLRNHDVNVLRIKEDK